MNEECTPTTEIVKEFYIYASAGCGGYRDGEFERWINGRDKRVKASTVEGIITLLESAYEAKIASMTPTGIVTADGIRVAIALIRGEEK